jgi:hypothetical protein
MLWLSIVSREVPEDPPPQTTRIQSAEAFSKFLT